MILLFQSVVKLYNTRHTEYFAHCFNFMRELYVANNKTDSEYRQSVLRMCAMITKYLFFLEFFVYETAAVFLLIQPAIIYLMEGKLVHIFSLLTFSIRITDAHMFIFTYGALGAHPPDKNPRNRGRYNARFMYSLDIPSCSYLHG